MENVTCVILDPSCPAMEQIIDYIWDSIHPNVEDDPKNNTLFKFYKNIDNGSEYGYGFGLWPLVGGYLLHMNCYKNGERIVILTHDHLEYEVDEIFAAVRFHQTNHFGTDLFDDDFFGKEEWNKMVNHDLNDYLLWGNKS